MKETFTIYFKTRWSDFDPNRHMRHSVYYDYAAEVRGRFFESYNFKLQDFARFGIGPVLFREEANFFKEIHIGETIKGDMELIAASKDFERWVFKHGIYNEKGDLSAEIKVTGAWIDLQKRKLTKLPESILEIIKKIPKAKDFTPIEINKSK